MNFFKKYFLFICFVFIFSFSFFSITDDVFAYSFPTSCPECRWNDGYVSYYNVLAHDVVISNNNGGSAKCSVRVDLDKPDGYGGIRDDYMLICSGQASNPPMVEVYKTDLRGYLKTVWNLDTPVSVPQLWNVIPQGVSSYLGVCSSSNQDMGWWGDISTLDEGYNARYSGDGKDFLGCDTTGRMAFYWSLPTSERKIGSLKLETSRTNIWSDHDFATLSWEGQGIRGNCSINNGVGPVGDPGSSINVSPDYFASGDLDGEGVSITSYNVTCDTDSGTITSNNVLIGSYKLPTVDLQIRKSESDEGLGDFSDWYDSSIDLTGGGSVDLKWSNSNVDTCNIDEIPVPPSDMYWNLEVLGQPTYNISCSKTLDGLKTRTANDSVSVFVGDYKGVCGTASFQDGWNLYDNTSDISLSEACSAGSWGTVPYENKVDSINSTLIQWQCAGSTGVLSGACAAVKTPTVSLKPDEQTIIEGNNTNLILETENVDPGSCTSPQPGLNPNVSSSNLETNNYSVSPITTTTYEVSCTSDFLSTYNLPTTYSDTAKVNVIPPTPTITAVCGTADYSTGDWWRTYTPTSINNANLCETDNAIGSIPTQYTDSEPTHTNYLNRWFWWRCNGTAPAPNNTVLCYAPKTPTISLKPPSQTIPYGGSATLTLETENLKNCTSNQSDLIPNVPTPEMTTRDYSVSPTTDTIYTVSCVDSWNDEPYSATAEVIVNPPAPIPTLDIKAQGPSQSNPSDGPITITEGSSVQLTWTSENVASCTATPDTSNLDYAIEDLNAYNSAATETPSSTTTYTIDCIATAAAGGDDISDSVTVNVSALTTPTVNAQVKEPGTSIWETDDVADITTGEDVDLKWSASNADSCSISPITFGNKNITSTVTSLWSYNHYFNTAGTYNYTVTCTNTNGSVTKTAYDDVRVIVTAPVVAPDPVCGIASSEGGWNFYDSVTDLENSTDDGDLCSVGSVFQSPTEDVDGEVTNFKWSCSNADNVTKACWALKTPTVSLTPPSRIINYGQSADLKLTTQNITSCTSNQPDLNPTVNTATLNSEDFTVTPPVTTDYDVTCATVYVDVPNQPAYTDTAQVIVNLPPPATLTLTANPTTIWKGDSSTLSWTATNVVDCSITTNGDSIHDINSSEFSGGSISQSPNNTTEYTLECRDLSNNLQTTSATVTVEPLPTVNLEIRKSGGSYEPDDELDIFSGDGVDLKWSSTNATSCIGPSSYNPINSTAGNYANIKPNTDTAYNIACSKTINGNSTEWASDGVTVYVSDTPPPAGVSTLDLFASDTNISEGETIILNWASTNLENCSIDADNGSDYGSVSPSNTTGPGLEVTPTAPITEYFISCDWVAGTTSGPTSDSVMIYVSAVPPVNVDLKVDNITESTGPFDSNITINKGDQIKIHYDSTNASSCTTTGFVTPPPSGIYSLSYSSTETPPNTKTYFVECTSLYNSSTDTDSITVTVTPSANPAPTVKLYADPTTIDEGESSNLTWESTNTTSCANNFNTSTATDNMSTGVDVSPNTDTQYTINCTGPDGSDSDSVTITVNSIGCVQPPLSWDEETEKIQDQSPLCSPPSISPNNFIVTGLNGDYFGWSCGPSQSCDTKCPNNTVADLATGLCIGDPDIKFKKWELDPNIVNEGDKCEAFIKIHTPNNSYTTCEIINEVGDSLPVILGPISGEYQGTLDVDPRHSYKPSCTYNDGIAPPTTYFADNEKRCTLNPDIIEF